MASTVPPQLQTVADRAAAAALLHAKRLEELRCVVDTSESCKALVNSPIFHGVTDTVKEGELVILYAGYDSIFPVVLESKGYHNCKYGHFAHSEIIGKRYGSRIESKKGATHGRVYVLRVTPRLWAKAMTLRTQIIQPSDQAVIISMLCLRPGSVVVESGTGSGALTISLAQAVSPHGQVFTFEFNRDRVGKILQDMKTLGIENLVTASHGDACAMDGFSIVSAGTADAVMLDVPNPWLAIDNAYRCLKEDGRICTYSPCIEQVQKNCKALKEKRFHSIKTIEVRLRNYSVKQDTIAIPDFEPLREKVDLKIANSTEGDSTNPEPQSVESKDIVKDKITIDHIDEVKKTTGQHVQNKRVKFSKKRKRHSSSYSTSTKSMIRARPFSNTRGHTAFLTFAIKMPLR